MGPESPLNSWFGEQVEAATFRQLDLHHHQSLQVPWSSTWPSPDQIRPQASGAVLEAYLRVSPGVPDTPSSCPGLCWAHSEAPAQPHLLPGLARG